MNFILLQTIVGKKPKIQAINFDHVRTLEPLDKSHVYWELGARSMVIFDKEHSISVTETVEQISQYITNGTRTPGGFSK